jgi:hypothetical protein
MRWLVAGGSEIGPKNAEGFRTTCKFNVIATVTTVKTCRLSQEPGKHSEQPNLLSSNPAGGVPRPGVTSKEVASKTRCVKGLGATICVQLV